VQGLYEISGLTKDSFASANGYFNELADVVKELKEDGIAPNAIAVSPREENSLIKEVDSSEARVIRQGTPIKIANVPIVPCAKIPTTISTNQSFALSGDFTSAVCLMPGGLSPRILRDPYSKFTSNSTRFVAMMSFGLSVEDIDDFRCLDAIS
jgi:HK97 family phage major capsid protein